MANSKTIILDEGVTELASLSEGGATVTLIRGFLSVEEATELKEELLSFPENGDRQLWSQAIYKMYGRDVPSPRLLGSMWSSSLKKKIVAGGSVWDENTEWVKNGQRWSPLMRKLRRRIRLELNICTDYAQLNHYRNGKDYIGYHTDSEMQEGGCIVSVSLGETRTFVLRHKSSFPKLKEYRSISPEERIYTKYSIPLEDGDVLIMDKGAGKDEYKHTVPARPKITGDRINITFRQL